MELPEQHGGSSLRDTLNSVFRRWRLVSTFFIATVATVLLSILFFSKTTYSAVAQLVVSPGRDQISEIQVPIGNSPQLPHSNIFNAEEQVLQTTELLAGRFLAERVVKAIGPSVLYKDIPANGRRFFGLLSAPPPVETATNRVMENVTAVAVGKSGLVNLYFKHEDPVMAARAVNMLSDAYVRRHLEIQKNSSGELAVQEQFEVFKKKLSASEQKLEEFKRSHNISASAKDEQDWAHKQVATYQTALNDTRKQQGEVESRLTALRAQLGKTSRSPGVAIDMQEKLTNLELQESELAQRATAAHPTLRGLRREIAAVRKQLQTEEGSKPYGTLTSKDGGLYGQLQTELLRNETEQKALAARAQAEERSLSENQSRLNEMEKSGVEFNHLQQQAQLDEQSYRIFMAKMEEMRIHNAMDEKSIANVRVIEPAVPPTSPMDTKRLLKIGLALLFGAAGGVALAFLLHFINGRVDTIEDVERSLDLPVLASIPQLDWRGQRISTA